MTTTYYASINDPSTMADVAHSGTSSTAGDVFELRMGNGTYVPTRAQVMKAIEVFERWIMNGGLGQAGTNLPPASS